MAAATAIISRVTDGDRLALVSSQVKIILGPGQVFPRYSARVHIPVIHQLAGVVIPAVSLGINCPAGPQDFRENVSVRTIGSGCGLGKVGPTQNRGEPKGYPGCCGWHRVRLLDLGEVRVVEVP